MNAFYNDKLFAGGNGTECSSSAAEYARMVIDRDGRAGYLTGHSLQFEYREQSREAPLNGGASDALPDCYRNRECVTQLLTNRS